MAARQTAYEIAGAVAATLVLLIPPTGVLSGNEEQYLAAALYAVSPEALPVGTSLLGGMPHATIFNWLFGPIVAKLGFETAQILGRLLAVALYTLALVRLFTIARLEALDSILVLLVFAVLGQSFYALEWMFSGIEPKILAYPFVLLAVAEFLRREPVYCFGFITIATYMHALVGGMWAAILFGAWLLDKDLRLLAIKTAILSGILVLPLAWHLGHGQYSHLVASQSSEGDAAFILAFVAYPFHATPFGSYFEFAGWLPGILAVVTAGGIAAVRLRGSLLNAAEGASLQIITATSVWLVLALVTVALDRSGTVGALTPFRPSSLMLLLCLIWITMAARTLPAHMFPPTRTSALVLAASLALPSIIYGPVSGYRDLGRREARFGALLDRLATETDVESVFVIAPDLEREFLDFERRVNRASYVTEKFVPGPSSGILEWAKRLRARSQFVGGDCAVLKDAPHVHYALVRRQVGDRSGLSCGDIYFEASGVVVLKLAKQGQPSRNRARGRSQR